MGEENLIFGFPCRRDHGSKTRMLKTITNVLILHSFIFCKSSITLSVL